MQTFFQKYIPNIMKENMDLFKINLFILLYNIVLVLPYINMTSVMGVHVFPILTPPHLPLYPIPLGHPSAPALSIQPTQVLEIVYWDFPQTRELESDYI